MEGRVPSAALTVKGLQDYLSISRSTIYRMIEAGDIEPVRVGGRVLFRRADADALLNVPKLTQPLQHSIFD